MENDIAQEGETEVEEEENPEEDADRESGQREPVPAEDAVEGMKKGRKKDKKKKAEEDEDYGEKSLSTLRAKYKAMGSFPKPKKPKVAPTPPIPDQITKGKCAKCGMMECKCGSCGKSLDDNPDSGVLGKALDDGEKSHVGEAMNWLDGIGADDCIWNEGSRRDAHYFSRVFSKMADTGMGDEDQKALEDGSKTLHKHRQACKDLANYFKSLTSVKAFGNPHRQGAKAWHKILTDLLDDKGGAKEMDVPDSGEMGMDVTEPDGEMKSKDVDNHEEKALLTLTQLDSDLHSKLDRLMNVL